MGTVRTNFMNPNTTIYIRNFTWNFLCKMATILSQPQCVKRVKVSCGMQWYVESMGECKKDVTPLLTHWSYVFLPLTHRNVVNGLYCCFSTWEWDGQSGPLSTCHRTVLRSHSTGSRRFQVSGAHRKGLENNHTIGDIRKFPTQNFSFLLYWTILL